MFGHNRMDRERATIEIMIALYCHGQHKMRKLCPECQELLEYARERLARCPFQAGKTTCGRCRVHCYRHEMREKVKAVMRYSGPRMIYKHPLLVLQHLFDGLRENPVSSK
jgi:predicted amidophosphoribosyltransferase